MITSAKAMQHARLDLLRLRFCESNIGCPERSDALEQLVLTGAVSDDRANRLCHAKW
jgi:hypothetical protein